jgi:hypothetical protein
MGDIVEPAANSFRKTRSTWPISMSDEEDKKRDYTSADAYMPSEPKRATVDTIPWDQAATMIDLEGRVPVIADVRECVTHFTLYKPHARKTPACC